MTIPLYNTTASADGWHEVRAPGGSEWWIFRGVDAQTDRKFVAAIFDGCPFHPRYRRMYRRYTDKPTRVAPPLPRDFQCSLIAIFERGQCREQLLFQFPPGSLSGSTRAPEMRLGTNFVIMEDSGKMRMLVGDDSLRIDVELDVNSSKASFTMRRDGQKELEISCDGTFEHSFATTLADAISRTKLGLSRPKIITCSAGSPAPTRA